ncbi:hypothetical protein LguiB_029838 [Lonicera macranthoides]
MLLLFKLGFLLLISISSVESRCSRGCDLALGSYYVWPESNLTFISEITGAPIDVILNYNPQIPNQDSVQSDSRIRIPFTCDCINREFLGHVFTYNVRSGDTYDKVANLYYANLTTVPWLERFNFYSPNRIPDTNARLNVTVNCSCGDSRVSKDYGLFVTYPLRPGESLDSVASQSNLTADLIRNYNLGANFSAGSGLVYIPGRDASGNYPPLKTSTGLSSGIIAGISVGGAVVLLLFAVCLYVGFFRKKKVQEISSLSTATEDQSLQAAHGMVARAMSTPLCGGMVAQRGHPTPEVGGSLETHIKRTPQSTVCRRGRRFPWGEGCDALSDEYSLVWRNGSSSDEYSLVWRNGSSKGASHTGSWGILGDLYNLASGGTLFKSADPTGPGASPRLTGITVDKSVEFSYEELSKATDDFSLSYKIGQGGFGAVYYAELRGEKAAIKKMDMQASREFLAELKVLTHVHHLNLVRLIGYCVEGSLFLVYEFIENGNLSQHLRGSERDPLPWATRVQIALDSARGLEYIHEHTVPVYIHRDIKSANILIDKNFHAKVADFGLTKLTEVGSTSMPTRLVGTFGYMPPEYAQYGDVSPKIDVYAFGVVIYELISAKEAIVKENGSVSESKGLVALFDEVLGKPDPKEDLGKLVDPRLGENYPLDSVRKMAQLAKACTHEKPELRPSMRSIVVALMTLSSSTEDWDIGSFYENQALVNLMSGR